MRILLVDDDPFARDVAVTALAGVEDAEVAAFAGGAQALAAVGAFQPDVVILDLLMPLMDGPTLWSRIQDQLAHRPQAIFLTARDDAATRADVTAMGASLVAKPFESATLCAAVNRVPVDSKARLEKVARDFAASLPATLSRIECAWRPLERGWQAPAAEAVLAEAHKLAGTAGVFRFHKLGTAADKLEELLRTALANDGWRGAAEYERVETAVQAILRAGMEAV